ncbi:hypothetical protein BKH41_03845 [Helicobacter sp. 12S02232-10]|uniref:hypothetical protein n=1 Tax=Helicobacter sp. 12S02232-10 TaxID=1476197 RepID=UPI000BA56F16|nr:hypothetical protein [Helicobacter sp. 12S02232-10]PAF49223.1 hypothetical protein BKH41_03845 [Helicobacter sp. 12S02232-10]
MTLAEKIQAIEEAEAEILTNLKNGSEISKYSIDGISIEKRSPIEMIKELKALKASLIASANQSQTIQLILK